MTPDQTNTPDDTSTQIGMDTGATGPGQPQWPMVPPRNEFSQPHFERPCRPSFHDDRFLRLYYENFHVAHPILVPSCAYGNQQYPHFLQLVVNFVGSHYVPSSSSQQYKDKVAVELAANPDRSPSMAQAWLIYSIALYARGEWPEAQEAFLHSVEIALALGMNRSDFASSTQDEKSIQAESLRRTWWELYVMDVLMAVPLTTNAFRCSTTPPEVALPSEESAYAADDIPKPCRIVDFKRRVFAPQETVFSSFSYRIDAATILCRVLVLNRLQECHRDHLQAVENALVSWINHLPPKKLDIVDSYGNIDEMMFQAHLIIAYAAMLLHLPRSDLHTALSQPDDHFWPGATCQLPSTFTRLVHSIKATEASRRISDYISVCPNVVKHTPFIIPALAVSGMIQLATSISHSQECFDHHCNRVTLILGCLKNTKRIWNLADSAYHRVRSSASEALSDSIERWSTEPLDKLIPTESASETDRTNHPTRAPVTTADGPDMMLPGLTPAFIDPTCGNAAFFNFMPDFDMS